MRRSKTPDGVGPPTTVQTPVASIETGRHPDTNPSLCRITSLLSTALSASFIGVARSAMENQLRVLVAQATAERG
jgi:hypothetical protein